MSGSPSIEQPPIQASLAKAMATRRERDKADTSLIVSTSHAHHPSKRLQGCDYPTPVTTMMHLMLA